MKKLLQRLARSLAPTTRAFALLLAVCAAGGAWAASTCLYTNADGLDTTLVGRQDGKYAWNNGNNYKIQFSQPSGLLATSSFSSSSKVAVSRISFVGRSEGNENYTVVTKLKLIGQTSGKEYISTSRTDVNNGCKVYTNPTTYWTRLQISFDFDFVELDTREEYLMVPLNDSGNNEKLGTSVVATGSQSNWKPAMRIYGVPLETKVDSTIGGFSFPTPGNSQITAFSVLIRASNIPSSAGRLIAWSDSAYELYLSKTSSGFEQKFLTVSSGAVDSRSFGTMTWTHDTGEHWLAVSYDRSSSTKSYVVGEDKRIENNSLKFSSNTTKTITLGGVAANDTDVATDMKVHEVHLYPSALTEAQLNRVVQALSGGWTQVDAATLTFSHSEGATLPGYTAVTAIGSFSINSDGTLDLSGITSVQVGSGGSVDVSAASGLTQVSVLSGGTATIGAQRPAQVIVMEGGTLNVSSDVTMNDVIVGYTPSATLTTMSSATFGGTVTLDGQSVTPTIDGGTVTMTGTPIAGNPTVTGSAWWWDYEFNGNGNNTGSEGTALRWDPDRPTVSGQSAAELGDYTTAVAGNQMLYLLARPWRDVSSYPSEFTAVMYCKAGTTANAVLVAFGSSTGGSKNVIALTTGENPGNGQMRLVLLNANNSTATDLVEGGFTLDNITSANHLYAFTVKTVGGNSHITVYADGDLLTTYEAIGEISLGTGFQVGSIHGSIANWMGLNYLVNGSNDTTPDTATMDFLRVFEGELTANAMSALSAEYPYVSPNGIATRVVSANGNWSDDTNNPWSQKTLNQDGSSTTTDQAAPNAGTVVDVIVTTDATLEMNLDSSVSYEKLTFEGSGAITVVKGGTAPTVTTRTYIKTDTTLPVDAFASLGAITVDDGKTLTLIPPADTFYKGIALGIGGSSSSIVTGTATLGTGASVVLDSAMVAQYASYGFNLSLTTNEAMQYVLIVERADGVVKLTQRTQGNVTATMAPAELAVAYAESMVLPDVPATIPQDFTGSVIIQNLHNTDPFTVATVFNGGAVPVTVNSASAPVVLTGDSTFGGAVSGTATLTISGDITLASGGSIANTIAGDGTITLSELSQTLTFGSWTGTVVLPETFTTIGSDYSLNNYGKAGSTVRLSANVSGWIKRDVNNEPAVINPTIDIPDGITFSVTAFSSSFKYAITKLTGSGAFSVPVETTPDISDTSYSPYFRIGDVTEFTGSLSVAKPSLVVGTMTLPNKPDSGTAESEYTGKILVYGTVAAGASATWTAPNGVVLMDASATLAVPSGATVSAPTSGVSGYIVTSATSDGTTTYSLVAGTVADDIPVPASWSDTNASGVADLTTAAPNGYSYAQCYALGLDPTDATDKPMVKLVVNANGTFTAQLVHADGREIVAGDTVTLTTTFTRYASPSAQSGTELATPAAINVTDAVDSTTGVGYIKATVSISAK